MGTGHILLGGVTVNNYDSTEDTLRHIRQVGTFLSQAVAELCIRANEHDHSKLGEEEKPAFDAETPKLKTLTYGTVEYNDSLKNLGVALDHHYAHNSHHPEHYFNGIAGMDLFDLVEMIADWKAAVLRMESGNIQESLEHNRSRFGIDTQLYMILRNTVERWPET